MLNIQEFIGRRYAEVDFARKHAKTFATGLLGLSPFSAQAMYLTRADAQVVGKQLYWGTFGYYLKLKNVAERNAVQQALDEAGNTHMQVITGVRGQTSPYVDYPQSISIVCEVKGGQMKPYLDQVDAIVAAEKISRNDYSDF